MTARSTLLSTLVMSALAVALFACDDGQAPDTDPRTLTVAIEGNGRGTITSDPAGIDCSHEGGTCSADFDLGAEITLTVTPGLRTIFAGWSGLCTGTGDCTFNLNDNATATVALDNPQLAEAVIGADGGSLTSPDSALTLTFPAGALAADTTITLEEVTADELGAEWNDIVSAGDVAPYEMGPSGLTFAEPVTATFRSSQAPETTDTSTTVTPELLLTAGDSVEVLGNMTTTVDADSNVVATAEIEHFSLVVLAREEGLRWTVPRIYLSLRVGQSRALYQSLEVEGTIAVAGFTVSPVSPVVLLSDPSGSYERRTSDYWIADHGIGCSEAGTGALELGTSVALDGKQVDLEAILPIECLPRLELLDIVMSGTGTGTVSIDPAAIDPERARAPRVTECSSDCQVLVPRGSEVTLTATPASSFTFGGWGLDSEECPDGSDPSITFTMGDPMECQANFVDPSVPGLRLAAHAFAAAGREVYSNSHATAVVEGADEIDAAAEAEAGALMAGSTSSHAGTTGSGTISAETAASETVRHVASVDAESGDFFLWRWSDPLAPELIYSVPNLCPGAHQVLYDPTGKYSSVPYFEILSLPNQTSCYVEVDTDGLYWSTTYNFVSSGEKALVPGSEVEATAIFQEGKLNLFDPSTLDSRTLFLSNGLAGGGERSCPYSVEATADRVFVVGREGEAGTSTENCNNWRKLFVVDISDFPNATPLEGSVDVGDMPRDVAINAGGTTAYVADFANDVVHVIDAATQAITRTLNVGDGPTGLAVTPDDAHLLVANWNAGTVQVIDLATDEIIIDHTTDFTQPVRIDLTGDGLGVVVTHWGGESEDASLVYYELYIP